MMDIQVELTQDTQGRDISICRYDKHPDRANCPGMIVTIEIIQSGYSESYGMHILSHVSGDTHEQIPIDEEERRAVLYATAEALETQHWELKAWADQFAEGCGCDDVCRCDPC